MPSQETAPRPIAWTIVERSDRPIVRTLPGVLRAIQRAELGFEVGGRVETVQMKIGEHFEPGEVLATLESNTYQLVLGERRGELNEALAALMEAESDYARHRKLYAKDWVSKAAFDQALSARDSARSRVDMARARVSIAEDDLADTVLKAPYAGSVARRLIEPSQQIAAGQTAIEVQGNGGGLEVVASVPETFVDRLELGSRHPVAFPVRPNIDLVGTLREIGTRAVDGNAFPVTLSLKDAPKALRSGLTAEVALHLSTDTSAHDSMTIPVTAYLSGTDDETTAFVYDDATGRLSQRNILIAEFTDDHALVSDGLTPGEIIATKGLAFLQDGQAVTRLGVGPTRYNP
nr:efflux RND transporter periplasmic adaptor subunit [uncultured Halomonas sp.]